jgi:hypothetical protein
MKEMRNALLNVVRSATWFLACLTLMATGLACGAEVDAPSKELRSSDPAIAGRAAEKLLSNAKDADAIDIMHAAMMIYNAGKRDDAVFWFYAGQLRARYTPEITGENAQVLTIYVMVASPINGHAMRDAAKMTRAIRRALAWDEETFAGWAWANALDIHDEDLANRRKRARDGLGAFAENLEANRAEFERQASSTPVEESIAIGPLEKSWSRYEQLKETERQSMAGKLYFREEGAGTHVHRLGNAQLLARGETILGRDAKFWVLRYYDWLAKNAQKYKSVQKDPSGALCNSLQNGPVWFLTNFQYGKVERACEIPSGKYVLIPILEALIAPAPEKTPGCEELASIAKKFVTNGAKVSVTVDGNELGNVTDYEGSTGCFERDDPKKARAKQTVATHGYWVFLKPLPPGNHRIEFKGEIGKANYSSFNDLAHDVTYSISVK